MTSPLAAARAAADPEQQTHDGLLAGHPRVRATLLAAAVFLAVVLVGKAAAEMAGLFRPVLVPALLALLFTGLLMPLQILFNHKLGLNRHVGAALTLVVAIGGVGGLLYVSGAQLAQGVKEIVSTAEFQLSDIEKRIADSPLPVGRDQVRSAIDGIQGWLQDNQGDLAQGAIGGAYSAASFVFGAFLCIVATFLFLAQGDRIASWLILLFPQDWRSKVYEAGRRGWVTLGTYTKMQIVISGADAVGIGLGAWALGLPFVLPLTAITFILCFIPVVGAFASGALVVLVALAFKGPTTAIIMLVIVIAVQQLESDVLSPILMGKAVNVHPLVVLLGIAAGSYLIGFLGALFAVPVIATLNTMAKYLSGRDPFPRLADGGSALTDSPGKLVGEWDPPKTPKRLGDATPEWLATVHTRQLILADRHYDEDEDPTDKIGH